MRIPTGLSKVLVSLLVTLAMLVAVVPAGASSHVDVVSEGPRPSLEGVAVDKTGNVFVTSTFTGELLKFAPGSSDFEVFATIDGWDAGGPGAGFLGLATDAEGNIYGAAQWDGFTGVYKFDRKTGDEALIAGTDQMSFPNAIAFDKVGNMYITDSNSTGVSNPIPPGDVPLGAIWRVDRNGNAMKWFESELLGGNGGGGLETPVGANGIAYRKGVLTVANAEGFSLWTVQIEGDGSAGNLDLLAGLGVTADWPVLAGPFGELPAIPDGIALDVHGGIYVASVAQNAVFRVNTDGSVDVLFYDPAGAVLNTPSSVAFGTGNGYKQTVYVVNLAFVPTPPFAPASLVAIDVGVPGMPLP
jgi:sugar lactone lactonase YvrE